MVMLDGIVDGLLEGSVQDGQDGAKELLGEE